MTSKKSTVIISAILTILGVSAFTFLQFRMYRHLDLFINWGSRELLSEWKQYGITISSGIFTSAFVTFLTARKDYLYERRNSLENMYLASEELQREFSKIKYIFPTEPKELICDLLDETDKNKKDNEHNKIIRKKLKKRNKPDLTHDAEKKFKEYLWEHTDAETKKMYTSPKEKEKYLDKECQKKIDQYNQELEDAMKSYIAFKDVRTKEITSAYGCLDFVFANKSVRQHIFEKLYNKQIDQVNRIKNKTYYFNSYFERNGPNKSLLFHWVIELQTSLISEDENAYYRQYQYDIDCELVQILIYAMGK